MNLLTTESWGWTAPAPQVQSAGGGKAGGAGLVQREWCIEVEADDDEDEDVNAAYEPAAPGILALAKKAVDARMDMVEHF